jgi:hypothetical protein
MISLVTTMWDIVGQYGTKIETEYAQVQLNAAKSSK